MFYPRNKRHFRDQITKSAPLRHHRHPAYIVGEERGSYDSFGLTEDPFKGKGHRNHRLSKNPDGSGSPSYLRKHMEVRDKRIYSKSRLDGMKMDPSDDDYVDMLISKRKH